MSALEASKSRLVSKSRFPESPELNSRYEACCSDGAFTFLQCLFKAWRDKIENRTSLHRQVQLWQGQVFGFQPSPHPPSTAGVPDDNQTRWPRHFWSAPTPTTIYICSQSIRTSNKESVESLTIHCSRSGDTTWFLPATLVRSYSVIIVILRCYLQVLPTWPHNQHKISSRFFHRYLRITNKCIWQILKEVKFEVLWGNFEILP